MVRRRVRPRVTLPHLREKPMAREDHARGSCEGQRKAAPEINDSIYWLPVTRRIPAFALTFVMIGGPLAGEICEAACTDHSVHSVAHDPASNDRHVADQHGHASHHHRLTESPARTTTGAMSRVPHRCEPSDAIVVAASRDEAPAAIAKALATKARVVPTLVELSSASGVDSRHGPPPRARSSSPLRI